MPTHAFKVIAHRGDKVHAPENTMPAFEAAVEVGADAIEFDVRLTRDGVAVLIHDADLKRVGGDERAVADLDWAEMRDLPVGDRFGPDFPGARAPTLQAALESLAPRIQLDVEIKAGPAVPKVVEAIAALDADAVANIVVSSFEADWLAEVRRLRPGQRIAWLGRRGLDDPTPVLERLDAWGWYPHVEQATAEAVAEAYGRGLAVRAWGVSTLAQAQQAVEAGAGGCTYDDPAELIAWLRTEGLRKEPS